MPREATQPQDTTFAFRMPADQLAFLQRQAERNERTVSAEIRLLVRQAMEQEREAA